MTAVPVLRRADTAASRRVERLFVSATFITLLGNNIQLIAASLLIYKSAGTAISVGWVYILVALPQVALSMVFGRLADSFDRRRLCIAADLASAVCAAALPVWLLLDGKPTTGAYAVSFGLALLAAAFMPASNALIKERVAADRLGHFNSNYEIAFQGGALLSGVIGGVVVQMVGVTPLFFFNAVTFLASAVLIAAIGRRPTSPAAAEDTPAPAGVAAEEAPPAASASTMPAGVPAGGRPPVFRLGLLFCVGTVLVTVANTLLLVLVIDRFRQGAGLLGVVDALAGIGMVIAATMYKRLKDRIDYRYLILVGYVGCSVLALIQPIAVWTLIPGILLGGLTFGLGRLPARTELMRAVDERRVGRVFGAANGLGLAASVVGTVAVATVADRVGIVTGYATLAALCGIPTIVVVVSLFLRPAALRTPVAGPPKIQQRPEEVAR